MSISSLQCLTIHSSRNRITASAELPPDHFVSVNNMVVRFGLIQALEGVGMFKVCLAQEQDATEILALQHLAFQSEALLYKDWSIPPLTQSLESLLAEFENSIVLKAMSGIRLVGSVRAKVADGICSISRLIVNPAFQGQGIGSTLLEAIELQYPSAGKFQLFTGSRSEASIRLYQRLGYEVSGTHIVS